MVLALGIIRRTWRGEFVFQDFVWTVLRPLSERDRLLRAEPAADGAMIPECARRLSLIVVLPWSTWAMTPKLRMCSLSFMIFMTWSVDLNFATAGGPDL